MVLQWLIVFLMTSAVVHGDLSAVDCTVTPANKEVTLTAANSAFKITIPNCANKQDMASPASFNLADCNLDVGDTFLVWVHKKAGIFSVPDDTAVDVTCVLDTSTVTVTQSLGVTTTNPDGTSNGLISPTVQLKISDVADCTGTPVARAFYKKELYLCLHMTTNYATHFGTRFQKVEAYIKDSPTVKQTLTNSRCSAGVMATSAWGNQVMMTFGTSGSALLAARIPFFAFFLTGGTLPMTIVFKVTAERCDGACGAHTCARKRRSVDEFEEDLESETVTASLTVNMNGMDDDINGATDDDQNKQQNGSADDVCINKGGFYGLLTFMAVSLLIAVLASAFMFMRARKSRMPLDERDLYYKEKNCSHNPAFRG